MSLADYLTLYAMAVIWILMAINVFLSVGGFIYYMRVNRKGAPPRLEEYPLVSVLVPAHNEGVVIERTVRSLLRFDYPMDRYEIIVINDNSSDNSAEVLRNLQAQHPTRRLVVLNTDDAVGGKGKSNALNIGFAASSGSVVAVYDADNTPEPQALRLLVESLMRDDSLGAVIGKFRTRNKTASLITRFVNIETLAYQCMNQAGRWFYFKLCTIPGTNFVIRRSILETIGGWDPAALSEDTEISLRIYRMGYRIMLMPLAVTWEQEPYTLRIWYKQRTRWSMGNIYVMIQNFKYVFDPKAGPMRLDALYYSIIYVLMLSALVCSDLIFLLGILGYSQVSLSGLSTMVWVAATVLFELNVLITLAVEKNEFTLSNALLILVMLFTYSKLWEVVVLRGIYLTIKTSINRTAVTWYKTERIREEL